MYRHRDVMYVIHTIGISYRLFEYDSNVINRGDEELVLEYRFLKWIRSKKCRCSPSVYYQVVHNVSKDVRDNP